jgi:phenylalanyl-tRNA synthetase beta chain
MKVSLNWIKQFLDFELPPIDELVQCIGAQLGAVEAVENLGEKYQGIVVIKVVECVDHPDSDHLHVCKVDDGGKVPDMARDQNGLVQVVCGAPNVHAGMLAAWLPPGATVPESVDKDPFVLSAREIRGQVSNGMLASQRELALGDDHEGIVDLTDEVAPGDAPVQPGADFASAFGLNDYVIEIENKMFTHRPDCFGQLGVAREIAGILGHPFVSPEPYRLLNSALNGQGLSLEISNEIPESVPRFMALAMRDVAVNPSPLWLQIELYRVGAKPISNVVDVTNYMMLLTGQPMHAYDYDKVASGTLGARFAKPGETLALLNGKTIQLNDADMVITDGAKPIGLAGVMGGADTEVSDDTKNIILECATFDMYTIRRTSMRHGLFTDAVTRFNKGQSPLQNPYIVQMAAGYLHILTGGEAASAVVDNDHTEGRTSVHPPVPVTAQFVNERLGLSLAAADMQTLLQNVECQVAIDGDSLIVTAPFWRTDIETREDVVEEVGRLYGFDKLPLQLPRRSILPVAKNTTFQLKTAVRAQLAGAGANEVLTYSFVHGDLLKKAGQNIDEAFQVGNALSPDLQYYRLSLTPSLLDKVHMNIKAGYDEFALFELGKAHGKSQADQDGLPREFERLALVYAASDKQAAAKAGAAYYTARKYLQELLQSCGVWQYCTLIPAVKADWDGHAFFSEVVRPFDPERSAVIHDGQRILGVVGEYSAATRRALKLPVHSAGFEFGLNLISQHAARASSYQPLPRFPKVTQDITLKVGADVPFQELFGHLQIELSHARPEHTAPTLEPLDIYQRQDDTAHQQITFRLNIASYERTLTDTEVSKLLDTLATAAQAKFGAERI